MRKYLMFIFISVCVVLFHNGVNVYADSLYTGSTSGDITVLFNLEDTLVLEFEVNSVDFGDVVILNNVELDNVVSLVVSSSKEWKLGIVALTDFVGERSGNVVNANNLGVKVNDGEYTYLEKGIEKVLLDRCNSGVGIPCNLGFKLNRINGVDLDTYTMTTCLKVEQR